jgi:lipopolysaccharide/colanic/teichoic acid biosynthesis glycosyltransferase
VPHDGLARSVDAVGAGGVSPPETMRPFVVERNHFDSGISSSSDRHPWNLATRFIKRAFDIAFALTVLILGSPLYLAIALIVKFSSPGPVFYSSSRIGRNGREFGCWKFRTMVADADERLARLLESCPDSRREFENTFKLRDDPRIIPAGRLLRKTSLDELPQFWNVLKGDMSIVGPRPPLLVERPAYGDSLEEVTSIRPGLTGLWQVSGRNHLPFESRIGFAKEYIENWTLRRDVGLVVKTVVVIGDDSRSRGY